MKKRYFILVVYLIISIIFSINSNASSHIPSKYDSWKYSISSVSLISIISLIGVITLSIKSTNLKKIILYLVSFSAGALLGDVFIHLLPEVTSHYGFTIKVSILILVGILMSFFIEKIIHWNHCHKPTNKKHIHPFAYLNLIGDAFHNLIDGIAIASSYLISIPAGIATTIAVLFHEIPQEIGDFGILIHGGFSKAKALFLNFITALTAILGAIIALLIGNYVENLTLYLIPIAAGNLIYIAASDLIPELHKEFTIKSSIIQLITFILGILVMAALLLLE